MVTMLDRTEYSALFERLEAKQFPGFTPVLKDMSSVRLGLLYSRKIGEVTLVRKLKEQSMDVRDIGYAIDFLMEHQVQPSRDNVIRLWLAARLYLMFDAKSPGWVEERLVDYGQTEA